MIKQGDIFDFDFGTHGDSRLAGRRPALVVQTDLLNERDRYPLTIVAACSTRGRESPSHVGLEPSEENGLNHPSYVKCEQVYTVPKHLLLRRRGTASPEDLRRIKEALAHVLALAT